MKNRKIVPITTVVIALAVLFFQYAEYSGSAKPGADEPFIENGSIQPSVRPQEQVEKLYANRQSNKIIEITGHVIRLLPDDNQGSRHQKFIVGLASGHTLLVSHNIDLAPRINALRDNDRVKIKGEYEWSERGGVVHWTHHDPSGRHVAGWIEHAGKRYD